MKKTLNNIKTFVITLKNYLTKDTDTVLWAKIIIVIALLVSTIAEGILVLYVLPHMCIEQITTGVPFKYFLLLFIEIVIYPLIQKCIYSSIKEDLETVEE